MIEGTAQSRITGTPPSLTPYALQSDRVVLMTGATPLHKLPRLSAIFDVDLWIKRDDLIGFGGGGNKVRKLEYLLAQALAEQADVVVTAGSPQSNHARLTAAAAAHLGLDCEIHCVTPMGDFPEEYFRNGNARLSGAFGASTHSLAPAGDSAPALQARAAELRAAGRRPFVIPVGGSTAVGCLGYIVAAHEVAEQATKHGVAFDFVVLATGSGGTQAGLIVGNKLTAFSRRLIGVSVGREAGVQSELVSTLVKDCLDAMKRFRAEWKQEKVQASSDLGETEFASARTDIAVSPEIFDGARGPGYGLTDGTTSAALLLAARSDGLLLDPVYTGKAFAGLRMLIAERAVGRNARVLFWHTGGAPALFAYPDAFELGASK